MSRINEIIKSFENSEVISVCKDLKVSDEEFVLVIDKLLAEKKEICNVRSS